MPKTVVRPISPVGPSVADQVAAFSAADQAALDAIAPFEEIAEQVIIGRTLKDMTQRQLADAIGTSISQISVIESGTHLPSGTTLQRLSMALGVEFRFPLQNPAAAAATASRRHVTVRTVAARGSSWAPSEAMYAEDAGESRRRR
jgi:transcriptional regulator with XRE-family HTH domain